MDLNLKTAVLARLAVHFVGSKNNLDRLHLSEGELELEPAFLERAGPGFLSRFAGTPDYYQFHHPDSLQFNEVYQYTRELFENREALPELSVRMARHLYNASTHPKVKGGELYVGLFQNIEEDGRTFSAIGLFKSEHKTSFLEAEATGKSYALRMKEGIELNRIDKGCLILNRNPDTGYDVLLFDNQNRGEEALYWKESFLGLVP
ncbi:MAG TPA: nucleoid-associated protein, partial [Chitinophagaceae bacterium]|nr:nucleoid-associated protein [Chitinophagaceae bacterium]